MLIEDGLQITNLVKFTIFQLKSQAKTSIQLDVATLICLCGMQILNYFQIIGNFYFLKVISKLFFDNFDVFILKKNIILI
jgi:hypothetical protein